MSLLLTIRIALRSIGKNKVRAVLTILGVVIGIAAVTTMVSLGQSAGQLVQNQFQSLGANVLIVLPANQGRGGVSEGLTPKLTARDSEALAKECPSLRASSPIVGAQAQVIFGNVNHRPRDMFGVGAQHLIVANWPVRRGTFFDERDISSNAKVCVIGETLVGKLFQTTNPIGEIVRINKIPFRVIGVLEKKGANLGGQDQDDILILPYTTCRKRLQGSDFDNVNAIMASAKSPELMSEAEDEMKSVLAERHHINAGEPNDFEVANTTQIAAVLGIITGTLTTMLASIAGLSLIVGGVGIMNIMLVSVTERTREIGVRMAVGATSRDILRQFLVEAVILSLIGGLVGFILGCAASVGITLAINNLLGGAKWPVVISTVAAVISFVFAAAVGIFFGLYPAYRASQLDPIDALRYE